MNELLAGTEVAARGLRWEVVFSQPLGPQRLYRLRALEGGLHGQEIDLLHPFEEIQPLQHEFQPERAAPLRNWLVYHQAFLLEQALGPDALLAVQPGRLEIQPYQLVPALRAIRMSRPRLLLADGVGLGKTIQAGLVLTELVARRIAHRILIVSPAGPLLEQWKLEMLERFGLRLDAIDRGRLEEIRRSTELGANPFDHVSLGIASIDFLKQERVLELLERTSYDVIVIDEAHHCMDAGSVADREDSLRRRLAQTLARRCDAFLLLTATPHDGNDRSFASLCELLDPSLVDGRGALRAERYRPHVIRRLKRHVTDAKTGKPLFRERMVHPRPVLPDPDRHRDFIALHRAFLALVAPELRRALHARRYSDVLSFIALLKRSVSTVAACRATLDAVASRLEGELGKVAESQEARGQRLRTLREYHRKLDRFGAASAEEEAERQELEAEDLAQQLAAIEREVRAGRRELARTASVVGALEELTGLCARAERADPKLEWLLEEISAIRSAEPEANVLVYTEYQDSQEAVVKALKAGGLGRVLRMSGDDDGPDRMRITERFRLEEGLVLVSTDAAAEGLNLHDRCHHLIHLELPFNPNRLEQRNGRIDRYGQKEDPIVRYLYLQGSFEERILLRLIAKYERQRARLTFVPNTLGIAAGGDRADERLLRGILDESERLFESGEGRFDFSNPEEDAPESAATRELLEEIERSLQSFERATHTHAWLGEAGLNAETRLLEEASQAREAGGAAGVADLARFVADAVVLDGGDLAGSLADPIFEVGLPPDWIHGLEDMPGYEPSARRIRLTTRIEVTRDGEKRPVGFLGRAHPLVRRALDRVRNLSFGGDARRGQDVRVSAVTAPVSRPTLLCTFLGRIASQAGRELERAIAVRVDARGAEEAITAPSAWLALADPDRAVRTADVWKAHFAPFGGGVQESARAAAEGAFLPLAREFVEKHRGEMEKASRAQEQWLAERAREITGTGPELRTIDLFEGASVTRDRSDASSLAPAWSTLTVSEERLGGFARDASQPPARRGEAEGVLRIHQQRMRELDARLALQPPEAIPLGLLMLIPEDGRGA